MSRLIPGLDSATRTPEQWGHSVQLTESCELVSRYLFETFVVSSRQRELGQSAGPGVEALRPLWHEHTELASTIYDRACQHWGPASTTVMIGCDAQFTAVLDRIQRFAESESPVLITGETGTGKELVARALYLLSARSSRPFIPVNCAQYQDSHLLASELFGHRKGSFTGAITDHVGLFESSHTGVLFLDEVAELSLHAQAMLLRALSEGEFLPVGDTLPRRVDVRVIAATSQDLSGLVQRGAFRGDLFHRLRSLRVHVPPVRERGDDWTLIREYYLRRLTVSKARHKRFSAASLETMRGYHWPGNVRELKALVDTGFHLSDDDVIEPRHFLEALEEAGRQEQLGKVPLLDVESACYERLRQGEGDFWNVVRDGFINRELSRQQVQRIVARGLTESRGSFKRLLPLFGVAADDYLRFMDFLRHHKLKPPT